MLGLRVIKQYDNKIYQGNCKHHQIQRQQNHNLAPLHRRARIVGCFVRDFLGLNSPVLNARGLCCRDGHNLETKLGWIWAVAYLQMVKYDVVIRGLVCEVARMDFRPDSDLHVVPQMEIS